MHKRKIADRNVQGDTLRVDGFVGSLFVTAHERDYAATVELDVAAAKELAEALIEFLRENAHHA